MIEARKRLENQLTGSMNTRRSTPVILPVPGITPPSWWSDDDEASQSSLAAMREMR